MSKKKILILEKIHESGIKILKKKFNVTVNINLRKNEIYKKIKNYHIIIIKSTTSVDYKLLSYSEKLELVGRAGTGLDNIDLNLIKKNKIKLLHTPNSSTEAVADFTIMSILLGIKNFSRAIKMVSNSDYRRSLLMGKNISEINVGIVGYGKIGKLVSKRLKKLGAKLSILDPKIKNKMTLNKILKHSDVISFHLPLIKETKILIGYEEMKKMKEGVILINTSRAKIFNKNFYKTSKKILLITDVISPEPSYNSKNNKNFKHVWLKKDNIIFTPHMASMTNETQEKISMELANKIIRYYDV